MAARRMRKGWSAPQSASERASRLTLSAAEFYVALASEPLLDLSAMGDDPEVWLVQQIRGSQLPRDQKLVAVTLAKKAAVFHRFDPQRSGLMEAVASILPRADGGIGLSSDELDSLFRRGSGVTA